MTTRSDNRQTTLKRRIRQFYKLLNRREFARCYRMIDPRVHAKPSSVTQFQYENAVGEFLDRFESVAILEISLTVHLDEPSDLYEGGLWVVSLFRRE